MNITTVAILMQDTLRTLGLKHLLESSFSVNVFVAEGIESIEALGENVDYLFTDPLTYASHIKFFIPRQAITIVVNDKLTTCDKGATMLSSCDNIETLTSHLNTWFSHNDNTVSDGILSKREIDVLRLVASGCINKEIADQLGISINTVLTHRKNITAKLGIKSASGLSFYALMNGIIDSK